MSERTPFGLDKQELDFHILKITDDAVMFGTFLTMHDCGLFECEVDGIHISVDILDLTGHRDG